MPFSVGEPAMTLSKKEIDNLVSLIVRTREHEIDCDECLTRISEFAEAELAGKTIPESLKTIEHHLDICSECREEYEVLKLALKQMKE